MKKTYKPEHLHLTEVIGVKLAKADRLLLERAAIERHTTISELVRSAIRDVVLHSFDGRGEESISQER